MAEACGSRNGYQLTKPCALTALQPCFRHELNITEQSPLPSKVEGQYLVIYFFCIVTGLRVSEAVAIEIDKHIELDYSIIYVRQQRGKNEDRVKKHLKTESGCRDVDIHADAAAILRNFIGDRGVAFSFTQRTERCSIQAIWRGIVSTPFSERWVGTKRERGSMFFAVSAKPFYNVATCGKS